MHNLWVHTKIHLADQLYQAYVQSSKRLILNKIDWAWYYPIVSENKGYTINKIYWIENYIYLLPLFVFLKHHLLTFYSPNVSKLIRGTLFMAFFLA